MLWQILFLVAALSGTVPSAQCASHRLVSPSPHSDGVFGYDVSSDGPWAVIGSPSDTPFGDDGAYIFKKTDGLWQYHSQLQPKFLPEPNDSILGGAVSLHGIKLIVGVRSGQPGGAALIFRLDGDTWTQEAALQRPNGFGGLSFAHSSVAICGDIAVVENGGVVGSTSGAFVFHFLDGDWLFDAFLPGISGAKLATDGQIVVVGTTVYERQQSGWVGTDLRSIDASTSFGHAVAVDNGTVAIGDMNYVTKNSQLGAVFVFGRDPQGWTETARILPPTQVPNREFGWSVDLNGSFLLITSTIEHDPFLDPRWSTFLFEYSGSGWDFRWQFLNPTPDPTGTGEFGYACAVGQDDCFIGAPFDDVTGSVNAGSVAVFPLVDNTRTDCNGNKVPDSCENPPCVPAVGGMGLAVMVVIAGIVSACIFRNKIPAKS